MEPGTMTVAELKAALEKVGIPSATPGITGEARHLELKLRWQQHVAIAKAASASGDDASGVGGASRMRAKMDGLKQASADHATVAGDDMFHFDDGDLGDLEGDLDALSAPATATTTAAADGTAIKLPPKRVPAPPQGAPPTRSSTKRDPATDDTTLPAAAPVPKPAAPTAPAAPAAPAPAPTTSSAPPPGAASSKAGTPPTKAGGEDDDDHMSAGEPGGEDDDDGDLDADQVRRPAWKCVS